MFKMSSSDTMSSVKMVVMATSHYFSGQNENTLSQLLRHVEVLLAQLKTKEIEFIFNKNNVIGSECITNLTEVLVNYNKDMHLITKVLQLLDMITAVPSSSEYVCNILHATSSLLTFVVQYIALDYESTAVYQCLRLLEKVTYMHKVGDSTGHLDKFINYLLQQIDNSANSNSSTCLGILNNLVSSNIAIQAQVKGMMGTGRIKSLMNYLRQESMADKVSALSIITFICWEDDLTKKLYSMKNVKQTLKLLLSRLTIFDDLLTQHRAADLCVELLKREEIAEQFSVYEAEQSCACRLLTFLQKDVNADAVSKILEVLLAFCQIPSVRHSMCNKIINNEQSWKILLNFVSRPLSQQKNEPTLQAFSLVRELCEEMIDSSFDLSNSAWLNGLLSVTIKQLVPSFADNNASASEILLEAATLKTLKAIETLTSLCADDKIAGCVAEEFTVTSLAGVIDHQLTHNLTGISQSNPPKWCDIGVDVVLNALGLALRLKQVLPELERLVYATLQDTRIVPFLARSITGSDRARVQTALRLHQEALPLPDFPAVLLAESISQINERSDSVFSSLDLASLSSANQDKILSGRKTLQESSRLNTERVKKNISITSLQSHSAATEDDDKENIRSLIAKMHANDEISSDSSGITKTSEIMEMYEHKISSFVTKENHLQDLLEAKTLALSQADRLIAQYRCQRARCEDDARKLADMLRETELRCEGLMENVRVAEADRASMERELQAVVEENRNLQKVADQYDQLQTAFQDKSHKIDVLERNLHSSRQEYDTLKELHDMMQKHSEKVKRQHGQAVARLEEVEEERMKLIKRISELEMSVSDLTQLVEEQDRAAHVLMQEKSERDVAIKSLKLQIGKREEDLKELKIKVASQDHSKQQIEHQLKEKSSDIKKLNGKISSMHKAIEEVNCEKLEIEEVLKEREESLSQLKQKLDKQAQTLLMITELSNNIRGSQS